MSVGRTFDIVQAAAYVGCHRNTIQRAAREGRLKGQRNRLRAGGPWFFTKEALDAFYLTTAGSPR
jgi:excisionase family DNA binding protein